LGSRVWVWPVTRKRSSPGEKTSEWNFFGRRVTGRTSALEGERVGERVG
jgi:hypothetical protein